MIDTPSSTTEPIQHRHIQSFVHRRSHFSKSQQATYQRLLPIFGVPYIQSANKQNINFEHLFTNNYPVVLEIGCGMGETTAAIAQACPKINFLGIEVYNAGVATLLQRIEVLSLTNLRIVQHDAIDVLRDMIPLNSLSGVHIFCPDPWPKARHLKRRLIQTPFINNLQQHLKIGAYIHCATDVQDYATQMLSVLSQQNTLKNLSHTEVNPEYTDYHPPKNPFANRPTTKFEARGQRLGHGMWDLVFEKIK
jgi:tRNA (guanine-N7-)-methyltransferase